MRDTVPPAVRAAQFPWVRGSRPTFQLGSVEPRVGVASGPMVAAGGRIANASLWSTDDLVLDMARSGQTLYLAGAFRSVGENLGGLLTTDPDDGEILSRMPRVTGHVFSIVSDNHGGWYIGGDFTAIGNKPRSCLARVDADGVVSEWQPVVAGSPGYLEFPSIRKIGVVGDRVFISGGFQSVNDIPRHGLASIDANTGALLPWDPKLPPEGSVYAMACSESLVFVGGYFFAIDGQSRYCLAALDASTGHPTEWAPEPQNAVTALLLAGDTLYVGGQFGRIGSVLRSHLAAVSARTGEVYPFDARVRGEYNLGFDWPAVYAMALVGDTLYVGGTFTTVGGEDRPTVAALDRQSGARIAWDPPVFGPVFPGYNAVPCYSMLALGSELYVGGGFFAVGDSSRFCVASLRRDTGELTSWVPDVNRPVWTIAPIGCSVAIGGEFDLVGRWRHRAGLAAIDLNTGRLKPWNPNPDGSVCTAIAVNGDRVFVSGGFGVIGGDPAPRAGIAAIDTLNGEVVPWNPGANDVVTKFVVVGDTLYAGGYFTHIDGVDRDHLAAFDLNTGEVTGWDPKADNIVLTLASSGQTIFAGGMFSAIGSRGYAGVAAIDRVSGEGLPHFEAPECCPLVYALAARGDRLYVGGGFDRIGGKPRVAIAEIDTATGMATGWNPALLPWAHNTPIVRAIALQDSTVIVGGDFSAVGDKERFCLAEVDMSTGRPTDWSPNPDAAVWSLLASGGDLFAGGGFTRAGGIPASGLVGFSASHPVPNSPPGPRARLLQIWPNPASDHASVRLSIEQPTRVQVVIVDIAGRRMAGVIESQYLDVGAHDFNVVTRGWRPGIYFCRVDAGGRTASAKILIAR